MNPNDRAAIEGLFGRLATVESQGPDRDAEAEALIASRLSAQPAAPYYMLQTIVVQEHALNEAQARIEQLEHDLASRPAGGGLFGGLFGGGAAQRTTPARRGAAPGPMAQPQQGGGFLAGAAQTAMGVAGGMLIANALGGMFGGEAQAAEDPFAGDAGGDAGGGLDELEF